MLQLYTYSYKEGTQLITLCKIQQEVTSQTISEESDQPFTIEICQKSDFSKESLERWLFQL